MSIRSWGRATALGVLLGVALVALATRRGCTPGFEPIPPGQVHAFAIPLGDSASTRDSTLCLVSVPSGYDPRGRWPLVVALHGYGSSAPRFHDYWRAAAAEAGCVLAALR